MRQVPAPGVGLLNLGRCESYQRGLARAATTTELYRAVARRCYPVVERLLYFDLGAGYVVVNPPSDRRVPIPEIPSAGATTVVLSCFSGAPKHGSVLLSRDRRLPPVAVLRLRPGEAYEP